MIDIKPIGVIHSELTRLEDCPRQESEDAPGAVVEIFSEFLEAASHIEVGDKILLFTWLGMADRSVLKTHPRNDSKIELTGVFSTRSPDRPNPIGIHTAEVISIDKNKFHVSALEVLNGTQVIDIKSK